MYLFLQVHYGRYNQRFGKDGIHEPLDWSETEAEAVAFKENFIYPTIIQSEIEDKSYPFCCWFTNNVTQYFLVKCSSCDFRV